MFSGSAARAEITELRIKSSLEKNLRQKLPFWSQMGYGLCIGYVLPYFDGTFPTRSQVWKSSLIWYIIVGISFKLALEKPEEQTAYYPRHKSAKRTSWSVEEIMFLLAATIAALRAAYCCSKTIFFHWQCSKMGDTQIFRTFSGEPDCLSHKDAGCQNLAWAWLAIPGEANRTILKESKISMAVSSGTSVSLSCNIYIIIYIYTYAWYVYIYVAIYTYSTKWIQNG
jgi:hypothetical protein